MLRLIVVLALLLLGGCPLEELTKPDESHEPVNLEQMMTDADTAYINGDWVESERLYIIISQRVPAEIIPWFRLGNIFARSDRPDAAVAAYREALIRRPEMSKAWHNMGVTQLKQAMKAFVDLQTHAAPGDPLIDKSERLYSGLQTLLDKEQE